MIMHFPKDNEWWIMRVNEDDTQYLSSNNERTRERKRAKKFFHKDSAEWAFTLCKIKWLKEEELKRPTQEKQSWDEL